MPESAIPTAYATESGQLARDLYQLLRDLDPKASKQDLDDALRLRAKDLLVRAAASSAGAAWPDARVERLRAALEDLQDRIEAALPAEGTGGPERPEWIAFRDELQPAYEALRDALRPYAIHMPSLRPSNYARNALHLSSGLLALAVVQGLAGWPWVLAVFATGFALFAWGLEIGRRLSLRMNGLLMRLLGPFAHPHEATKVNSSTWYATALMVLAWTCSPMVISVAIAVLAVGDPVAAIIGRRFGRTRITNGRSLEGSLAFVGAGALAAVGVLVGLHGVTGPGALASLALVGSVAGAVAELVSRTVDDNFSIPLASAAGAGVVALLLGL